MPGSVLKFAIVGCGRIAQRHAEQMQHYGLLQAVCDTYQAKADALGSTYNCNVYYTLEELLANEKSLDVVAVCTPNGLHAAHSIAILNAGIHVLCEKPMAITTEDCNSMIAASETNKKQLFIVKQNRFNPPVAVVKELLEKNILGKIYSVQLNCFLNINDYYYKNTCNGTKQWMAAHCLPQFSHFIDLLYWMFGDVKYSSHYGEGLAHNGV